MPSGTIEVDGAVAPVGKKRSSSLLKMIQKLGQRRQSNRTSKTADLITFIGGRRTSTLSMDPKNIMKNDFSQQPSVIQEETPPKLINQYILQQPSQPAEEQIRNESKFDVEEIPDDDISIPQSRNYMHNKILGN